MVSPTKDRTGWLLPAGLIALGAIPVVAGVVRLSGLAAGVEITPDNERFMAAPVPVTLHIVSAVLFTTFGAFQFAPRFRRRRPSWHRGAGWLVVGCGLITGLSGLWMTQFYPRVEGDGALLYGLRVLFGSAMVVCILLGFASTRRRHMMQHGAWMSRGYAIGMGAGTQALVHLPFLIIGKPGEHLRALLMGAGWVINLAVAEYGIRRARASRAPFQTAYETPRRICWGSRSPRAAQPR
jgi:hypothetical protein